MAKIIVEINDELKKQFVLKIVEKRKTQKEVLTKLIKNYMKEG